MEAAAPPALPVLELPAIDGVNVYRVPPTGAIAVPACVYRPDSPWIERSQTYKAWIENYVAVFIVNASAGVDGAALLYELALKLKDLIDHDPGGRWEWKQLGGIVEAEQAGLTYLAAAVRLSFRSQY